MDNITVNKVLTIRYVASGFTSGLSDLVMAVRKPNGDPLSPAPTLVEIGTTGVYEATYTPDVVGVWQESITSATNGDKVVRSHNAVAYDILDVKTELDSVATVTMDTKSIAVSMATEVGVVDSKATVIASIATATKTVVDSTASEVTVVDSKATSIQSIATATKTVVDATASELVVVDSKVGVGNSIAVSTAAEVVVIDSKATATQSIATATKTVVDSIAVIVNSINTQVKSGGYFA